jgi:antirestriction protein ArdC
VRTTAEQREAKLRELHDTLTRQVETLTSSDGWQAMLRAAARFHQYSPSNVLLITAQRPDATHVAGLRTWNALGRHVRRGEKGIAILAPRLARAAPAEAAATPEPSEPVDPGPGAKLLRGFLVVHVFDVGQTDGEPLPVVEPQLLDGEVPPQLWGGLAQVAETQGYALERGPCSGANGWTDFARRVIRVRDDVSPRQACKTLAHELGHAMADHEHRFTDVLAAGGCRGIAEVEAESIAYLVLANQGVPTDDYSVPYVAGWANGQPHLLRSSMDTSLSTAHRINDQLNADPAPSTREPFPGSSRAVPLLPVENAASSWAQR